MIAAMVSFDVTDIEDWDFIKVEEDDEDDDELVETDDTDNTD